MWKNTYILPQSIFPQRYSRLWRNIEESMNVEEYTWNVEQFCSRLLWNIEKCLRLEEYCDMWNNIVECGRINIFFHIYAYFNIPQKSRTKLWNHCGKSECGRIL